MFKNNVLTTRRETTDVWQSENPILNDMELGVEIILNQDRTVSHYNIKLGDGITSWNSLDYFYEGLDKDATNEILDDFTINLATRKPAANRIPIYNDDAGLKSGKQATEPDDVVRLSDVSVIVDGTDIPTANKIVKYNEDAGLKSDKEPTENNDVVRKLELDTHKDDTAAHSATETPTASRIAMYNEDTKLKSGAAATENNDVLRFLEFNDEISDINSKISTLNGAYYVLDSYNFGKTIDETNPDDILILNTYTIANTPNASSMADVYNDTVVVNEFDSAEYVYNKISELWVKYPNGYLTIATNDHLGVVKGTQPPANPDDESKDTYVQVLVDGAMKLVGDRLGKVNSVDNVAPDTDKNIELTITMTKSEYDALENPVGSGLYPSLKGKTVILTDIYPYENSYSIDRPDLWPINTEINFGNNLYGIRAADVTFNPSTTVQQIALASGLGTSTPVSSGGSIIQSTDSNSAWTIPYVTGFKIGFKITTAGVLTMIVVADGNQSGWKTANIWITYKRS
jgi:hypothetical protein